MKEEIIKELPLKHMVAMIYEDEIERLQRALRFAAGIISTYPPHVDQHPEEVYNWIIKESDYDNGG